MLSETEGKTAITLARCALEEIIAGRNCRTPDLTPVFDEKRGVFVTLKKNGDLRGCIGFVQPILPLKAAIPQATLAAATEDPRFHPVQTEELPAISLEVTVLTVSEPLAGAPEERANHITVGRHGLIIQGMGRSGLLLPQVAPEWGWNETEFLDQTCRKAGLPAGCWKRPEIQVLTFEGQVFSEVSE